MVLLSPATQEHFNRLKACKPISTLYGNVIPVVDMNHPDATAHLVEACKDYGFFKVVNHGIPLDLINKLESEATKLFNLPQSEKDKAGPPEPLGYASKQIGLNGDFGWVEYLFLDATNHHRHHNKAISVLGHHSSIFGYLLDEYIYAMKGMTNLLLEMIADGLGIEERNVLSRMVSDIESDLCFRINNYPICPELQPSMIGFGEHTDPQMISVLRSNNTSGLQICLKDGTWVSVPPDHTSFFINIGDALQVLTNGMFKSVKHRVLTDTNKSRLSMIYFGAPPLNEKITPLPKMLENGVESLYYEFTWAEYKASAYKSRLADYRLGQFEKKTTATAAVATGDDNTTA